MADSKAQQFGGKIALVTGAARSIGREIAITLHDRGASVYVLDNNTENLMKLKADYPAIETVEVDLKDPEMTKETVNNLPTIDLLVNNAGVAQVLPIMDLTDEQLSSNLDVNVKAVVNVTQCVARKLIAEKKQGSIVNMASVGSSKAYVGFGGYCISKAALSMATKVFAKELGPHGIRVNEVQPTVIIHSEMAMNVMDDGDGSKWVKTLPLGRCASMTDIVNGVMYLLSDDSYIATGLSLILDGGNLL